jgi:hypothetical protein
LISGLRKLDFAYLNAVIRGHRPHTKKQVDIIGALKERKGHWVKPTSRNSIIDTNEPLIIKGISKKKEGSFDRKARYRVCYDYFFQEAAPITIDKISGIQLKIQERSDGYRLNGGGIAVDPEDTMIARSRIGKQKRLPSLPETSPADGLDGSGWWLPVIHIYGIGFKILVDAAFPAPVGRSHTGITNCMDQVFNISRSVRLCERLLDIHFYSLRKVNLTGHT